MRQRGWEQLFGLRTRPWGAAAGPPGQPCPPTPAPRPPAPGHGPGATVRSSTTGTGPSLPIPRQAARVLPGRALPRSRHTIVDIVEGSRTAQAIVARGRPRRPTPTAPTAPAASPTRGERPRVGPTGRPGAACPERCLRPGSTGGKAAGPRCGVGGSAGAWGPGVSGTFPNGAARQV